jgi:hypothetical protein
MYFFVVDFNVGASYEELAVVGDIDNINDVVECPGYNSFDSFLWI